MARTHVVMSDEVLEAIDEVAGKRGRSHFLEQAAIERIDRLELERALDATAGLTRGSRYRHWRDRHAAAEWVRKTRRTEGVS